MQVGGLLSADPLVNPRFFNFSLVFVHYCDGSSHTSNASSPIPAPAGSPAGAVSEIWMRGRPNLAAVLAYLQTPAGGSLGAAAGSTELILSGGSAGGTSVFLALDWVASILPPSVKLIGAPDAGYFVDAPIWNKTSDFAFRDEFIAGNVFWGSIAAGSLNADCVSAYSAEPWHCFFPEYHTPYLKTPWHAMMAALDAASLNLIIDICTPPNCDAAELEALRLWRFTFLGLLAYGLDSYEGNGWCVRGAAVQRRKREGRSNLRAQLIIP